MTLLEIFANIFLVAAVFLAARNHWFNWVLGTIACILFGVLFYQNKLYADTTLQVFFIATNLIGLWHWKRGGDAGAEKPVTRVEPLWKLLAYFPLAALAAWGYGTMLAQTTDAHYPLVDSGVLTFSIVAQFLLMARKIETWIFWLIVNSIAAPLFFVKELYLTSFIYVLFWFNAFHGYWKWRQEMNKQPEQEMGA